MAKDAGEALFERYIAETGYEILDYEPDLGTLKRPDYLIRAAGVEVVVEVESFNLPVAGPTGDGVLDMRPEVAKVRNKITAGATQLKGITGRPLVVVLANPGNARLPLEGLMFIGALYGDPVSTITADGVVADMRLGRNGRLHVTESDGSVRGNHPYLSAVAVLRRSFTEDTHAAAMLASQSMGHENLLATVREAHRIVGEMGEEATEAICLDVHETVSRTAVPLPRAVFTGPYDTRWGEVTDGRYRQITLG